MRPVAATAVMIAAAAQETPGAAMVPDAYAGSAAFAGAPGGPTMSDADALLALAGAAPAMNPLDLTGFGGAAHPMLPGVAAVAGMLERDPRAFAVNPGLSDRNRLTPSGGDYMLSSAGAALGIQVSPRAGVKSDDLSQTAGFGGVVRFGEGLSDPRTGADAQGWHMFIGADAQAVTWKLDRSPLADGAAVRVEDKELVGDAQAGVAIKMGGGDLAVGFVHREIKSNGVSADEQFGGVTFKVRR